jgi:hypothetical protein
MQTKTDRQLALRLTTNRLLELDRQIKQHEEEKKQLREEFFKLANEEIQDGRLLDRQLVEVPADEGALAFVECEHPGWRLVQHIEGSNFIVIEEDPSAIKYSYTNPDNGMVFSRQVAQVGIKFDVEGFMRKYPELAESVIKMVPTLNEAKAEIITQTDPETVPAFQEFTGKGRLQPKLAAPRKATEDDLA